MNVPAVAKRTYEELKQDPNYVKLVEEIIEALLKINSPESRARYAHELVDDFNKQVFAHPLVKSFSPCKKGCSACCHTQVSITEDEATLLAMRVDSGITIDELSLET